MVSGKKYCLDTSGLSNPWETLPEDIFSGLWIEICTRIESGIFAVTAEIYSELARIDGILGECIRDNKSKMLLEIGEDWNWSVYLSTYQNLLKTYQQVISEYNGNRKSTVGVNDMTIIALGKSLGLPVVNREAPLSQVSNTKKRIPEVCTLEGVKPFDFNDFLRAENIKV